MWVLALPRTPITPPQYIRSIDYPDGNRTNIKIQYTDNILEAKRYTSPQEVQYEATVSQTVPIPIPMR